jgi:hypothetical protein
MRGTRHGYPIDRCTHLGNSPAHENDMLRRGLPYAQRLSYVLTSSLFGLLDVN